MSQPPEIAQAQLQTAVALHQQGKLAEAAGIYERLLAADKNHFESLHYLGVIAYQTGDPQKAVEQISKAIKINPKDAAARSNLGAALQALGRQNEALTSFDKAIELAPGYAQGHYNRANALQALGRAADAVASHQRAIALKPDYAEACNNLGVAFRELGRFDEAVASHDRAIELKPDDAESWNNRGIALRSLGRLDDAVASYISALERKLDFAEACNNLGVAYRELGRFDDALASYNRAIALKPDFAEAHYHKAQIELLRGNLGQGWQEHEWRKRTAKPSGTRTYQKPLLTSLDQAGEKTVLVHWEQGLGDTIQFCRYALLLRQAGARVLFAPQPQLKGLMASLGDDVRIVGTDDPSLSFDYHIPLLSLPLLFATTAETIPSKTPYLFADAARVQKWRARLGTGGFKIGICSRGKSTYVHDASRSFSAGYFEPLSQLPNVRLINLYKSGGETAPPPTFLETLGDDFDSGLDAFADTAAVIKSLDLVITSDTSIAHLAGALAAPVWVALASVPDWRWMLGRDDSPWYPTMRLFRQKNAGDWTGLFEEIKAALIQFVR